MIFSTPEADMVLVSRSSQNQRKSLMNFAPRIGLSIVDYATLHEIDHFYLDCQNFRDYYRDPHNKLPRPLAFKRHYGKCGSRFLDSHMKKLMQPTPWIAEKQPITFPIENQRNMILDGEIRLGGRYYSAPCVKYKH